MATRSSHVHAALLVAVVLGVTLAVNVYTERARAANVSVCASSCDFATIADAINSGLTSGTTITVGADYASTTEAFSFNLPTGVTLDCQNSGAVIGVDDESFPASINSQSDNVIQNCRFANVSFENTNQSNVQFLNNGWSGNSRITQDFASNVSIVGNTGLRSIIIGNSTEAVIDANTISSIGPQGAALRINSATSVSVTNNVFSDQTTSTNTNYDLINITNGNVDVYFATNTIESPMLTQAGGGMSSVELTRSQGVTIRDNLFSLQGIGGTNALNINGIAGDISVNVTHNSIKLDPSCNQCVGILVSTWMTSVLDVTSTYNLIGMAGTPSSTAVNQGHNSFASGPASNLRLFVDHEGFAGISNLATADFPVGSHAVIVPFSPFKVDDVTTTNDFEQVPYSVFLDVNGAEDMGAVPAARGNDFQIVAAGLVDYAAIDATTTDMVMRSLRHGDTVRLADGSYAPFALAGLSGISVLGSGSSSVVTATSSDAIHLVDVTTSTFRDLTVTGATSTITTSSAMTLHLYAYNGNTYDQSAQIVGSPNGALVFKDAACSVDLLSADGQDVTAAVGAGHDDWNVALVDIFGNKITILMPSRFVPDAAAFAVYAATQCGSVVTVDRFVQGIFTANGDNTLSFNAANLAAAGVTLKPGLTNPPKISFATVGGSEAGFFLEDSQGNVFTRVTSTANPSAVRFLGTSGGNTFIDSTFHQSFTYDILDEATADNALVDTLFQRTKSSIQNTGTIHVRFTPRVFVQNSLAQPLEGVSVTLGSANAASSTVLTTGVDGFTPFGVALPAYVLTNATLAETSGGFNPYQLSVAATPGYLAYMLTQALNQPHQTFSLSLPTAPVSPGGGGGGSGPGGGGIPYPTAIRAPAIPITFFDLIGKRVHDLVKLPSDGNLATQEDSAVYYLGADGKRHVFTNSQVYASWYCDFSAVQTETVEQLAKITLGKNVVYRSGLRLVKFLGSPVVYLVQPNGVLRAVKDEQAAAALLGADWNTHVDDISDAFYGDYVIGEPLVGMQDLVALDVSPTYPSGNMGIPGYEEPVLAGGRLLCLPVKASVVGMSEAWPMIPDTFMFDQAISIGSTGTVGITQLQQILAWMGPSVYPEAQVTGAFGPATQRALKRFQALNGLPQTGALDEATRQRLNGLLAVHRH